MTGIGPSHSPASPQSVVTLVFVGRDVQDRVLPGSCDALQRLQWQNIGDERVKRLLHNRPGNRRGDRHADGEPADCVQVCTALWLASLLQLFHSEMLQETPFPDEQRKK